MKHATILPILVVAILPFLAGAGSCDTSTHHGATESAIVVEWDGTSPACTGAVEVQILRDGDQVAEETAPCQDGGVAVMLEHGDYDVVVTAGGTTVAAEALTLDGDADPVAVVF